MRKLSLIAAVTVLALVLFGCNVPENIPASTPPAVSDPTTLPTEAVTEPTLVHDPASQFSGPMIAVSMPLVTENIQTNSSNAILFYNRFQNVSFVSDNPESSQTITLDLLNKLDALSTVKSSVYEAAQKDYKNQSYWYPYRTSIIYEPTRLDNTLLSFIGTEEVFDGTPRSATVKHSVTYELTSGEILSLKSILHDDFSADSLCELIFDGLSSYTEDSFFGDYKTIIHDMFNTNVPVNCWYFTENGLVFYFNPYEIAPHSLGTVYSEIPYEKLLGILKETYFPTEKDQYTGTIKVSATSLSAGDSIDNFSRFAELNLSDSKQQVIISCDGSVTDLRIYMGEFASDGVTFNKTAIVLSAYGIGPGDAIVIHADATTVSKSLAISYKSNGQTHFQTFRMNADGSLSTSE